MDYIRLTLTFWLVLFGLHNAVALTSGPTQPEFASFEPVDGSDLVDPQTGNFSWVLPLGEVKSPAGLGYPITLSYHAGVMYEQEATWVGLGWSLNSGAINRQVRGVADDVRGEYYVSFYNDPGESGWNVEVGGGIGYSCVQVAATVGFGYSTAKGRHFDGVQRVMAGFSYGSIFSADYKVDAKRGTISVDISLGYGGASVGLSFGSEETAFTAGYSYYGKAGSVGASATVDVNGNASGRMSLGNKDMSFNLYTNGSVGFSSGNVQGGGYSSAASFSQGGVHSESSTKGVNVSFPIYAGISGRFILGFTEWSWRFNQLDMGNMYGYLYKGIWKDFLPDSIQTPNPIIQKYLTGTDWQYSSAPASQTTLNYLARGLAPPPATTSSASSVTSVLQSLYNLNVKTSSPKFDPVDDDFGQQDIYSISGQGIGGAFKPVSYTPIQKMSTGEIGIPSGDTVLAPYKIDGFHFDSIFNSNYYNIGNVYNKGIIFKMLGEAGTNYIDCPDPSYSGGSYNNLNAGSENIGTQITPLIGIDPGVGNDMANKLQGFVVADQQGKTYYYTLPLYSLQEVSYTNDASKPPMAAYGLDFRSKNNFTASFSPYATTWLLTAVTGPDYFKVGNPDAASDALEKIMPHDGDLGYWVRFRYEYGEPSAIDKSDAAGCMVSGRSLSKASYLWRLPYYDIDDQNANPTALPHMRSCENKYSSSFGMKEITYLKSIETASEVAFFTTSDRDDGRGADVATYPALPPSIALSSNELQTSYAGSPSTTVLISNNVSKVFQITVSQTVMRESMFDSLADGSYMGEIVLEGTASYNRPFTTNTINNIGCGGSISIRKDTYKCANGQVSQLMHADVTGSRYVKWVKCYDVKNTSNGKAILYVVGYKGYDGITPVTTETDAGTYTGIPSNSNSPVSAITDFAEKKYKGNWQNWIVGINPSSNPKKVIISPQFNPYLCRNEIVRSQKRLDKISWYSKSAYPLLDAGWDPEAEESIQFYAEKSEYLSQTIFGNENSIDYPQSYKKVLFSYNYTLANGTPNSKNNGGRLTLAEVRTASGGSPAQTLCMPPYRFNYQRANELFSPNYDEATAQVDPWGFRNENLVTNSQSGIMWNLNKIEYPSGGTIEIAYERDNIDTTLGMLIKMLVEDGCQCDVPSETYTEKVISISNDGVPPATPKLTKTLNCVGGVSIDDIGKFAIYKGKQDYKVYIETVNRSISNDYALLRIVAVSGNTVTLDRSVSVFGSGITDAGTGNQTIYTGINNLKILRKIPAFGGDIKTTSIVSSGLSSKRVTKYDYSRKGTYEISESFMPRYFSKRIYKPKYNKLLFIPYQDEYFTGGSNVTYPDVTVTIADKNMNANDGYIKHYFYTNRDLLNINGQSVPIVHVTEQNGQYLNKPIKIKKIVDRSAILGKLKKSEFYDNKNRMIKTVMNEYAYGEELAAKSKVYYGDQNNSLTSDDNMPPGIMQERTIIRKMKTKTEYPIEKIVDVVYSLPYLTRISETASQVKVEKQFGMFDAMTGGPMLTIDRNSDNTVIAALKAPISYVSPSAGMREAIVSNNQFCLEGATMLVNATNLPHASVMDITFNLLKSDTSAIIRSAMPDYCVDNPRTNSDGLLMRRVWLRGSSLWKGGKSQFNWATIDGTQWQNAASIVQNDNYSRPLIEVSAEGNMSSVQYHPRMNTVSGVFLNCGPSECGVYTCDYWEGDQAHFDYFDYQNGWKVGPLQVSNGYYRFSKVPENIHFGQKSLHVFQGQGPMKEFAFDPGKTFVVSAWVKRISGAPRFGIELYNGGTRLDNGSHDLNMRYIPANVWTYMEQRIVAGNAELNATKLKVWIGCKAPDECDFYIDDIRVYPASAQITTFYYDQDSQAPIASVNSNNSAAFYQYDKFGRLIKKLNNAKTMTAKAEYSIP